MKNKAPLALMEQLVMVLVFALAAALCLQVFLFSDQVSRRNELKDRAVLAVQSAAETIKHTKGDYQQAAQTFGGSWDENAWHLCYNEHGVLLASAEAAAFAVSVSPADSGQPQLGMAEVTAETPDGDVLFSVSVAWQEVDENAQS